MSAMSDFLENKLIDWFFRGQALGITGGSAAAGTGPTNLYVGLFTANPTDTGGGTEVTGGSYTRVTVASNTTNWDNTQNANTTAVSSGATGTTRNSVAVTWSTNPTAGWGTVTGVGLFDAVSGGNLVVWMALGTSKVINTGDVVSFPINSLTFQIDN